MLKCDFNKVACNFTEITVWHGCSLVNLPHIFTTPFPKNISGGLLLKQNPQITRCAFRTLLNIYYEAFCQNS